MPLVRIPIPNKVAWYVNITLAGLFGIVAFFLAITNDNITRVETVLLVVAGLLSIYFLRRMVVDRWVPWGWSSLPEIVWNIVGIFTIFEIAKVLFEF